MDKLIFVPIPYDEEAPHSLLRRAARAHEFKSVGELSGVCIGHPSFRSVSLTQSSEFAKLFAIEAGASAPRVVSGFYPTIKGPHQKMRAVIAGVEVPIDNLRMRNGVYCDDCFAQGYEHQIEDFKVAEYCPYHDKQYLSRCQKCHVPYEWWSALDGKCRSCEALLVCQPCTPDQCRLERGLLKLLRNGDQAEYDQLSNFARSLGYRTRNPKMSPEAQRMSWNGAFAIATGDPDVIFEHLRTVQLMYPSVDKRWIAARLCVINTPAVEQALTSFMTAASLPNTPHLERPFLLTGPQIQAALHIIHSDMHSLTKLPEFFRKPHPRVYSVEEAEFIEQKASELRTLHKGRLPRPEIEMWTREQAYRELSISPTSLKIYVRHGLLNPYRGRKDRQFFLPSDVVQISNNFESIQSLSERLHIGSRRLFNITRLLDIEIKSFPELSYRDQLLIKADAHRVAQAVAKRLRKSRVLLPVPRADEDHIIRNEYFTIREARKKLHLRMETLISAIRINLINGVCRGRKNLLLIPRTEVAAFPKRYCTTVQAAGLIKAHAPVVPDLLFALGVPPLLGPLTDGTRDHLYNRSDIQKILVSADSQRPEERFNYLSNYRAAKKLSLTFDAIRRLTECGAIKFITGTKSLYFMPSWLEDFSKKFITAKEILKLIGLPSATTRWMTRALEESGIKTVHFKKERSIYLYDRDLFNSSYAKFFAALSRMIEPKKKRRHPHSKYRLTDTSQ
jgi:hypothetical protein